MSLLNSIDKGCAYSFDLSEEPLHSTNPPKTERAALPEPNRAIYDAFCRNFWESELFPLSCSSMEQMHRAKALIADADEAKPAE